MSNALLMGFTVVSAFVAIFAAVNMQCGPDETERRRILLRMRDLVQGWQPMWSLRLERRHRYPFCRLVALPEAAAIACERLRGSRAAATANAVCNNDKVAVPNYFAALLGDRGSVNLYGYRRDSKRLAKIARAEYAEMQFIDGGAALKRYWEGLPMFTKLQIARADLNRRIEQLEATDALTCPG